MMLGIDDEVFIDTRSDEELLNSPTITPRRIFTERFETEERDWPVVSQFLRSGNKTSGWQCPPAGAQTN